MVYAADLAVVVSLAGAASAVGFSLCWSLRYPLLALLLLLLSLIVGQVARAPLPGQGGGLLVSDGAVGVVLLAASVAAYRQAALRPALALLQGWLPWMIWSLATLLLHRGTVEHSEWLIGLAYWLRTTLYLLMVPALVVLLSTPRRVRFAQCSFVITIVVISLLGLVQLWWLPTLTSLGGGWDPHEGRLVSSWLDPNFVGGLLAITLPYLLATVGVVTPRWSLRVGSVGIVAAALLLTQSRSSFLALGVSLTVFAPLALLYLRRFPLHRRVVSIGVSLAAVLVALSAGAYFLGERSWGLLFSDATVRLRWAALTAIWPLAAAHSTTGVGYNLYQFAAAQAGLIVNFTIHSRAGADASLLTLWVTTGIVGLLTFVAPWLDLLRRFIQAALRHADPIALAAAVGLITWFIHGQFVNSLLYPHLLVVMALMTAVTLSRSRLSA